MDNGNRDHNIKAIIKMEERIGRCSRCPSLIKCTGKPSLGKGDLEPQVLLVFECESSFTCDTNWIIELRNLIKQDFGAERVYHSFMVRCQPKACIRRENNKYVLTRKLVDRDETCILTNHTCDGIPIKPSSEEIINCLTYLLEEMKVLKSNYVLLFGQRVSDYVLKSCGVFKLVQIGQAYKCEDMVFLTTVSEKSFNRGELQKLGTIIERL